MGWPFSNITFGGSDTEKKADTNSTDSSPGWYNSAFDWYHSDGMQGARNELDKVATKTVEMAVKSDAEKADANKKKYQDIHQNVNRSSFDFAKNLSNKNVMYIAGAAVAVVAFIYLEKGKK